MNKIDKKLIAAVTDEQTKDALGFIRNGADINAANHKGQSVLALAANRNLLEVAKVLLEKKAVVDSRDQWSQTPLMRAAYYSHLDIIRLLLAARANINARNNDDKTPLLYAAQNGKTKVLRFLIEKGADINAIDTANTSALIYAAIREKPNLTEVILKHCNNQTQRDWNGKNALDYAIEMGQEKTIKILKRAGLKKSAKEDIERQQDNKKVLVIKKSVCPACAAPKITPSRTAFIYCDFCASFMDWDHRLALKESMKSEEVVSEAQRLKLASLAEKMESARIKGEAAIYGERFAAYTDEHMKLFPAYYSPRIGDSEYRQAYLKFMEESTREIIGNREIYHLLEEQTTRSSEVLFNEHYAESISFWKMFEAAQKYRNAYLRLLDSRGILKKHPDFMTPELMEKLDLSMFLRTWMPYLSRSDSNKIIAMLDRSDEYILPQKVPIHTGKCGGCGNKLSILSGARKIVCEGCGCIIDPAAPEISCPSCSFRFLFPDKTMSLPCPSCGGLLARLQADR